MVNKLEILARHTNKSLHYNDCFANHSLIFNSNLGHCVLVYYKNLPVLRALCKT